MSTNWNRVKFDKINVWKLMEWIYKNPTELPAKDTIEGLLSHPYIEKAIAIVCLGKAKDKEYGNSWQKRGDVGALHNVARKWDRLEQQMNNGIATGKVDNNSEITEEMLEGEGFLDSVLDLTNYSLMWLNWIADRFPEQWKKKMEEIGEMNKG